MPIPRSENETQNRDGEWVPSIPFPLFGLRKECHFPGCHKHYFTEAGYRGHYALAHILKLPDKNKTPARDDSKRFFHEHPDR